MRATMNEAVIFELLRRVPLFARATAPALQQVARAARVLTRKKGARIFEEGNVADGCYVFTEGRAKIVLSGPAGAEITLGIVEPFELVGDIALLDGWMRSAGLVALEDCHVIQISRAAFHGLRADPGFDAVLILHVVTMLRRSTEQLRAIYTYDAAELVCWCLAKLAHRSGTRKAGTIAVAYKPTHQELADMTGLSRETVSRVIGQLEEKGWITQGTTFRLAEPHFRRYLEAEQAISDIWLAKPV